MKTEKKEERIINTVSPAQRAKGIKLPHGNPSIVALDKSAAKLPTSLVAIFTKIESEGKEGVKLESLRGIKSLGASRHITWKVRTLVKMEYVKAVAEPKEVTSKKAATTKKAVAITTKKSKTNNAIRRAA